MHKVFITQFAKESLKNIHEYYKVKVSVKVADKIRKEILETLQKLKQTAVNWEEDEFLQSLGKGHRRVVCGNYKIIYYRDSMKQKTFGTDIFDARQSPEKEKG